MSDGRREAWDDDTRAYRESVAPAGKQGLGSDPGEAAIAATSPGEMDVLVMGILDQRGKQTWEIEREARIARRDFNALGDALGSAVRASLARLHTSGGVILDKYHSTTSGQDEWRLSLPRPSPP